MGQPPLEDEIQAVLVVWETVFVGAVREPPVQVEQIVLLVVGANTADRHSSLAPLLAPVAFVHGLGHHFHLLFQSQGGKQRLLNRS